MRAAALFLILASFHISEPASANQDSVFCNRALGVVQEWEQTCGLIIPGSSLNYNAVKETLIPLLNQLPKELSVFSIGSLDAAYLSGAREAQSRIIPYGSATTPWVRDFFPEIIRKEDGSLKMVQFKYHQNKSGYDIPSFKKFAQNYGIPLEQSSLWLDGGDILMGERQDLYVNERVLEENKDKTLDAIIRELKKDLGAKTVTFLPHINALETNHADMVAKYIGNKTVLVSSTLPLSPELENTAKIFKNEGYQVIRIDGPDVNHSYTNTLLLNVNGKKIAVVPQYSKEPKNSSAPMTEFDHDAETLYAGLGYQVIPISVISVIKEGGAIHCLTKTVPVIK